MEYRTVAQAPVKFQRPLVIGAGPCGLFAALILAQSGFRPILLERGKVVRERTKDTWGLWRRSVLNPESNVQFGEGGAGTFSDGKLYSQIKDPRYLGRKVLTEFVKAGAPEEILTEAHPHIGTFRLVTMVENMRETIEKLGGEYRFQSKVVDLLLDDRRRMRGVRLESGEEIVSDHVVLALGHSARDTFEMLHDRGVAIQAKPFSLGFRIEHPQGLIDKARFGRSIPQLGAADYKLVHHARNGRGVYSFCMCPGGTVVAACVAIWLRVMPVAISWPEPLADRSVGFSATVLAPSPVRRKTCGAAATFLPPTPVTVPSAMPSTSTTLRPIKPPSLGGLAMIPAPRPVACVAAAAGFANNVAPTSTLLNCA